MQRSITLPNVPPAARKFDAALLRWMYAQLDSENAQALLVDEGATPQHATQVRERMQNFLRDVERAYTVPARTQQRKYPSINTVASQLRILRECQAIDTDGLDVRLQVLPDSTWNVYSGDPQYDTDHRGVWGAVTLSAEDRAAQYYSLAKQLLDECKTSAEASRNAVL